MSSLSNDVLTRSKTQIGPHKDSTVVREEKHTHTHT